MHFFYSCLIYNLRLAAHQNVILVWDRILSIFSLY